MNDEMRRILEGKEASRRQLRALPFSEKVKLLEKLRDRSLAIACSRREIYLPESRKNRGRVKGTEMLLP